MLHPPGRGQMHAPVRESSATGNSYKTSDSTHTVKTESLPSLMAGKSHLSLPLLRQDFRLCHSHPSCREAARCCEHIVDKSHPVVRAQEQPNCEPRSINRRPQQHKENSCNTGGPLAFTWAFILCSIDTSNYVITQTFREGRAEVHRAFFQVVLLFGWEAIRNPPESCKNALWTLKIYCMQATQLRCLSSNILCVIIQRR